MTGLTPDEERASLVLELLKGGIRDRKVIEVMERMPRDAFVPDAFRARAYQNIALPIEFGQTISQPFIVAYMTELLKLTGRERVLEVGTGSGYQAAILSRLCRMVYTIERYPRLLREAKARFNELKFDNIVTKIGDGSEGWEYQAPFDRIVSTAAATKIPNYLVDQLKIGGILVIPVGSDSFNQKLVRGTREQSGIRYEELLPVRFVPLVEGIAREE